MKTLDDYRFEIFFEVPSEFTFIELLLIAFYTKFNHDDPELAVIFNNAYDTFLADVMLTLGQY